MPYLIDGHNLIGAMPDICLDELDDERRLIERLQAYGSRIRKTGIVYFDRRAPGQRKGWRAGMLSVRFISAPSTADHAIITHLERLGGEAHNYTVVSSDHEIQRAARRAGARVLSSQAFVHQLQEIPEKDDSLEKPHPPTNEVEIDEWMQLFQGLHDVPESLDQPTRDSKK